MPTTILKPDCLSSGYPAGAAAVTGKLKPTVTVLGLPKHAKDAADITLLRPKALLDPIWSALP